MRTNKKLVLSLVILSIIFLGFLVSAVITTNHPLDGTNHSSAALVLLNVTFLNSTDLLIFNISQTNVNASFYRVNGTQRTLITNSSACNTNATGTGVTCWTRFNVSGIDGFYNITSTIFNLTANRNSSINISSVYFDSTKPAIFPQNFTAIATGANYSQLLTINISAIDSTIGVQSVVFNITNSTGQNATAIATREGSTNYYSASINTSHYPDGVYYNITAYVNDSLGNLNNSAFIYQLTFDNTKPGASYTCDEYIIEEDDVMDCDCTGSDATSGINTSYGTNGFSFDPTPSTSNTGNNQQSTCTSLDLAGNTNTSTVYYNVTSGSSTTGGSSSGGSSSGGSTGGNTNNTSNNTNNTSGNSTSNNTSGNANQLSGNQESGLKNLKINYWILSSIVVGVGLVVGAVIAVKKGLVREAFYKIKNKFHK